MESTKRAIKTYEKANAPQESKLEKLIPNLNKVKSPSLTHLGKRYRYHKYHSAEGRGVQQSFQVRYWF